MIPLRNTMLLSTICMCRSSIHCLVSYPSLDESILFAHLAEVSCVHCAPSYDIAYEIVHVLVAEMRLLDADDDSLDGTCWFVFDFFVERLQVLEHAEVGGIG